MHSSKGGKSEVIVEDLLDILQFWKKGMNTADLRKRLIDACIGGDSFTLAICDTHRRVTEWSGNKIKFEKIRLHKCKNWGIKMNWDSYNIIIDIM